MYFDHISVKKEVRHKNETIGHYRIATREIGIQLKEIRHITTAYIPLIYYQNKPNLLWIPMLKRDTPTWLIASKSAEYYAKLQIFERHALTRQELPCGTTDDQIAKDDYTNFYTFEEELIEDNKTLHLTEY